MEAQLSGGHNDTLDSKHWEYMGFIKQWTLGKDLTIFLHQKKDFSTSLLLPISSFVNRQLDQSKWNIHSQSVGGAILLIVKLFLCYEIHLIRMTTLFGIPIYKTDKERTAQGEEYEMHREKWV